ncbi:hypothetical protein DY000_02042370 [Brassica cretica]|uniref:Uncharacterized protein n=1 Tax=Brassica cretica TaxID=69181 RepID=A0ABQ7BNH0_BRACR|nr:hypothetical protein DY000_02042370 [Brassica cretica]
MAMSWSTNSLLGSYALLLKDPDVNRVSAISMLEMQKTTVPIQIPPLPSDCFVTDAVNISKDNQCQAPTPIMAYIHLGDLKAGFGSYLHVSDDEVK